VWFGENVPMIELAVEEVQTVDILVIIGTSLNVYPAAGLVSFANAGTEIYLIDPKPVRVPNGIDIKVIQKGASEGMAILCNELA
jgi:NAD-dependent deacetylase